MRFRIILLGVFLNFFANLVSADKWEGGSSGWVIGGGVGSILISINPKNQPDLDSGNETAEVYTVLGGYNFTNWFGVEFDVSETSNFKDENTKFDAFVVGRSLSSKIVHNFNDNTSIYFKPGLQYIAYHQEVKSSYNLRAKVWSGTAPVLGAGVGYTFDSSVSARLDYKYSRLTLSKVEGAFSYTDDSNDEEIELNYSSLMLLISYQF